jgi:hypothetical protein
MLNDISLRDWVATYAALVSSITVGWNIYRLLGSQKTQSPVLLP